MVSPGGYDGFVTVGGPLLGSHNIEDFEFELGPDWQQGNWSSHNDGTNKAKNEIQDLNQRYLQEMRHLHDHLARLTDPNDSTFSKEGQRGLLKQYPRIRDRVLPQLTNENYGVSKKPIEEKINQRNVRDVLTNFMREHFKDLHKDSKIFIIFLQMFDDFVRQAYLIREFKYCMPKEDPTFKSVHHHIYGRRPVKAILGELLENNIDLFSATRAAGRRIFRTIIKKDKRQKFKF